MADAWGIEASYVDSAKVPRDVPAETIGTLRAIIGRAPAELERTAPLVVRQGRVPDADGEVELEDGTAVPVSADLPLGYHRLHTRDGLTRRLIVSPGVCRAPDRRAWGWAAQLYATRSSGSWGIGDLADLRTLTGWARNQGAGFVLVNPLHAVAPTMPQQPSPYFPATRQFRNPVYLSVPAVAGFGGSVPVGATEPTPVIDRDAVWRHKRTALREIFDGHGPDDGFAAWRRDQGEPLQSFAVWCALTERHGASWREWPPDLRRADGDAVTVFAADHRADVEFHAWLQYLLSRQLTDATGDLTVIQDLPIGVDPDGFDAWTWQDVLAPGVSVGAPPDPFNLAGQDWGLPPFVPWRLRAADYQPFIDAIRSTIAAGGGLRIDHVMGLFRLWWVPPGEGSHQGAYVRYPAEDLLDIVALESHRAGAIVVGEDLGTVEDGVRETLAARNVLSYRLFWFEDDAPRAWPAHAMAALTTHDLPTVVGAWTGTDLDDQRASGVDADEQATTDLHDRIADAADLDDDATPAAAVLGAYRALAAAPCALVSATLDDAALAARRPNVPGTTERDNWSIPLPLTLDELRTDEHAATLARTLDAATREKDDQPREAR